VARISWGDPGTRLYEAGVDRGVFYLDGQAGVPWNGLTSVNESPTGGDPTPFYIDGYKYLNNPATEEYEATVTAFTYPDEFSACDGMSEPRSGLFITQQRRQSFGLSYRTMIGNDQSDDFGYKIHLVYNALASPTTRTNGTLSETTSLNDFSWKITTKPPAVVDYKPFAHVVIDSRSTDPSVLSLLEDALYGTDSVSASLPTFSELLGIFDTIGTLTIVDNGDGTWTATAPFDVIEMTGTDTFEITSPTAVFIDADSYTISSA
jgi:hypothetical protein